MALQGRDLELQVVEKLGENDSTEAFLRIGNRGEQPLASNWRLYFSLGLKPAAGESRVKQTLVEGRYGYLEPGADWVPLTTDQVIEIPIENWLFDRMPQRAQQGFHLTFDDSDFSRLKPDIPTILPPDLLPLRGLQNKWITETSPSCDTELESEEHRWQINQSSYVEAGITPVPFPVSFKVDPSVISISGLSFSHAELIKTLEAYHLDNGLPVKTSIRTSMKPEAYQIEVTPLAITITAGSDTGIFYAAHTLRQLLVASKNSPNQSTRSPYAIPICQITDEPELAYRGAFIDLARHFIPPSELKRVILAMSAYKMNVLQLGISNDEGFRLEITGIPELTDIGARRTFHATSAEGAVKGLYPAWGDGPEEVFHYLTRSEFVDLIAFAKDHHVTIIPELNLPAHANAIIRSMQASGRYEIVDSIDESQHQSAQGYANNVINVCLPDTYRLAEEILQEFVGCYLDAGTSMTAIHLGGDEIPAGAWLNSTVCKQSAVWDSSWNIDKENDRDSATQALLSYFISEITSLVQRISPGTEIGFWHEMSPVLTDSKHTYITGWTTEQGDRELIDAVLAAGQQLVIANASFLYLDMPYTLNAAEPGLPWAAYIDESLIYHFDPLATWSISEHQRAQIKGLQSQLWSELIYSSDLMHYHLFPRLLAVAERAWRTTPEKTGWPGFAQALGERELNYLESIGIRFRVPPPGIHIIEEQLHANVAFPGLTIRYTKDGSLPTFESTLYINPIAVAASEKIVLASFTPAGKTSSRPIFIETRY